MLINENCFCNELLPLNCTSKRIVAGFLLPILSPLNLFNYLCFNIATYSSLFCNSSGRKGLSRKSSRY